MQPVLLALGVADRRGHRIHVLDLEQADGALGGRHLLAFGLGVTPVFGVGRNPVSERINFEDVAKNMVSYTEAKKEYQQTCNKCLPLLQRTTLGCCLLR